MYHLKMKGIADSTGRTIAKYPSSNHVPTHASRSHPRSRILFDVIAECIMLWEAREHGVAPLTTS